MRVELYNTVLSVLTALTIVLGMRLMGAMLISSLVIFPALTAMRLLRSFRGVVICAGVLSVACFCAGLTGSYLLSTPVGATVVLADLAAFLLAWASTVVPAWVAAKRKLRDKPASLLRAFHVHDFGWL